MSAMAMDDCFSFPCHVSLRGLFVPLNNVSLFLDHHTKSGEENENH